MESKSIAVGFCSTHTRHFEQVFEDQADAALDKFRVEGAKGAKFMVFGRYDHLFVVTGTTSDLIRKVDRGLTLSKEVANQCSSSAFWTDWLRSIVRNAFLDMIKIRACSPE